MPRSITDYRVFIASPAGLEEERRAFRDVLAEYTASDAAARGVMFSPVGWEDTLGGVGRPQSLINSDLRQCDFLVVVLSDRWGSPPDSEADFTSGTEEEFAIGIQCYWADEFPMQQIVILFKAVDPRRLVTPDNQLSKVLEFRQRLETEKEHLFEVFDSSDRFRTLLRKHLALWLLYHERGYEPRVLTSPALPVEAVPSDPPNTSPGLIEAWALADHGRRTEAEALFARLSLAGDEPEPFIHYGRFLRREGRLDQAMVTFYKAQVLAHAKADLRNEAVALHCTGSILLMRGDLDGAERSFRQEFSCAEKAKWEAGMADSYGDLGRVFKDRGDLVTAERMHRKALALDERCGRLEGVARHCGNLAIVVGTRGDLRGAEQLLRRALEIDQQIDWPEGMADHYCGLGEALRRAGKLDAAEEMFKKALEIDERLGRLEGIATNVGNLALVLDMRGNGNGAERMFWRSLQLEQVLERPEGIAISLGSLGNILLGRQDLDGAEAMYRRALELNERYGHLEGLANNYSNLGLVMAARGDLDGAEQLHRKALEIDRKFGESKRTVIHHLCIGSVLRKRGDLAGAKRMDRLAQKIRNRLDNPPEPPLPPSERYVGVPTA